MTQARKTIMKAKTSYNVLRFGLYFFHLAKIKVLFDRICILNCQGRLAVELNEEVRNIAGIISKLKRNLF